MLLFTSNLRPFFLYPLNGTTFYSNEEIVFMQERRNQNANRNETDLPAAHTGNASNPAADEEGIKRVHQEQLLDEKAETYVREAGTIEDLPDAQDQQDMDETLKRENR